MTIYSIVVFKIYVSFVLLKKELPDNSTSDDLELFTFIILLWIAMLDLNRDNFIKLYVEMLLRLQRQIEKLSQVSNSKFLSWLNLKGIALRVKEKTNIVWKEENDVEEVIEWYKLIRM